MDKASTGLGLRPLRWRWEQVEPNTTTTFFCQDQIDTFFLRLPWWISQDIQKESVAELEAAQLSWKDVNKAITTAAKAWYQEQINAL